MRLIESNMRAFQGILRKPHFILPSLLLPAVMLAMLFIFQVQIFNLLTQVFFLENIPEGTIAAFPVQFIAMYPIEVPVVALLVFVFAVVSIAIAFFYARAADDFEGKGASIGKAWGAMMGAKGNIFALGLLFFIIALFSITIAWLFLILSALNEVVGFALLLLFGLLLFYLFVKLAFTVAAMAIDSIKVKEALAKSWAFTTGRFFGVLILLIVVAVVNNIIIGIGDFVSGLIVAEEISVVVFLLFWALGTTYSNFAVAFYYLKNASGK